jgi:hypothetical protein
MAYLFTPEAESANYPDRGLSKLTGQGTVGRVNCPSWTGAKTVGRVNCLIRNRTGDSRPGQLSYQGQGRGRPGQLSFGDRRENSRPGQLSQGDRREKSRPGQLSLGDRRENGRPGQLSYQGQDRGQ